MEDINIIIRSICQDLYENLRHNHSMFSSIKSRMYLSKLKLINLRTDYKYVEIIRDELGLLYKNYMVFCKKQEYDNNLKILKEVKNMYSKLCFELEQLIVGNGAAIAYSECKHLDDYIKKLNSTYGGQTEKYIKKLSKKRLGVQRKQIKNIYKDKSKIITEKKKAVTNILQDKLEKWNYRYKREKEIDIIYNSEDAEYTFIKMDGNTCLKKKKFKFKNNFSDIEKLQKSAIKKLKQLNFGMSVYEELKLKEICLKYVDPFVLTIFVEEGYLDYAKMYLRALNGESRIKKSQLPFRIKYKINENFSKGKLTPVRNEIIAIIADRNALTVAEIEKYINNNIRKISNIKILENKKIG